MNQPGMQPNAGKIAFVPGLQPSDPGEDPGFSRAEAFLNQVLTRRARRDSVWAGFPIGAPGRSGRPVPYSFGGGK